MNDASESSDEHFSSASEGDADPPSPSGSHSPIPLTRVERVDDKPHHGEVPGTSAYALRTQDAVPDEIEIVPEGAEGELGPSRSRSGTLLAGSQESPALNEDGAPTATSREGEADNATYGEDQQQQQSDIPKTVVEKVDDEPRHGEVEGTAAKEMRLADAAPDEVRITGGDSSGPEHVETAEQNPEERQAWFRSMWDKEAAEKNMEDERRDMTVEDDDESNEADDDFGDDFDEFAEGGNNGEDDDFGDFDDADVTPIAQANEPRPAVPPTVPSFLAGLPPLDLKLDLPTDELQESIDPYLDAIFPDAPAEPDEVPAVDMSNTSAFLSDRSLSLWQQLVSPPPMQPPNWTRSRIRRLFLVSLGVPVDLDEILPPSKQKRLILPNINLGSPRASTSALERLKQSNTNDSTTSIDSKTGAPKKSKRTAASRGPPPPPDFDANAAALVCGTTEEAMSRFGDTDLKDHVSALESLNRRASSVLEYWLQRKDESLKEKEALEGVIENLVGFVKGRRTK